MRYGQLYEQLIICVLNYNNGCVAVDTYLVPIRSNGERKHSKWEEKLWIMAAEALYVQIFWHQQLACVLKCEDLGWRWMCVCGGLICANVVFPTYASVLQSKKRDNVFCCAVESGGTQLLFATDVFYATETVLMIFAIKQVDVKVLLLRIYI